MYTHGQSVFTKHLTLAIDECRIYAQLTEKKYVKAVFHNLHLKLSKTVKKKKNKLKYLCEVLTVIIRYLYLTDLCNATEMI